MIQVVPALARAKMNTMAAIRPRISPAPVNVAYPVSPDTWLAGSTMRMARMGIP